MRRVERYYDCIVCEEEHEGEPAAEIDFDPDVRATGGALVWSGHPPVNWPRANTTIAFCPTHARELVSYVDRKVNR